MSSLYEQLQSSSNTDRRAVAEQLVAGMVGADGTALTTFHALCRQVILDTTRQDPAQPRSGLRHGEFTPRASALLVTSVPRVSGYARAIARAPQAKKIIGAGAGSSAILEIIGAVTHPNSSVIGFEINEQAVRCAQGVVALLGLSDQISIEHRDVLDGRPLPRANLAIDENFEPALLGEQGVLISHVLAESAAEILPSLVEINACDESVSDATQWQHASLIDLRESNAQITGNLVSTGTGTRPVSVQANYYDARHDPVVVGYKTDRITHYQRIGAIDAGGAGETIHFSYAPGSHPDEHPAQLWIPER